MIYFLVMRVLIKISGEMLAGESSSTFSKDTLENIAKKIEKLSKDGHSIGIVVGGGNIFRGESLSKDLKIERETADYAGMLATIQNALVLKGFLENRDLSPIITSAIEMHKVVESTRHQKTIKSFDSGKIIIFSGGLGHPFFSTDTTTIQRALEFKADMAIMVKNNVDGVYDEDPKENANAKKYDSITATEVLNKKLSFADNTAIALARDEGMKIRVISFDCLERCFDESVGTTILAE